MPKNEKDDLLKKIINLIFEDVPEEENENGTSEEVILEAPVVEHKITEKLTKPEVKTVVKPQVVKAEEKVEEAPVKEEVKVAPKAETVKKTSFGINLNEKSEVKPQVSAQTKPIEEPIINKYKSIAPRYEFKPTISPMFGVVSNDDEKIDKTVSMAGNVNEGNDSKIGTIFSPYYGVIEPHKFKEDKKFSEVENFPEVTKIEDNEVKEVVEEEKVETKSIEPKIEELLSPISENLVENNKYEDKAVEDVLSKPNDETYVMPETISLFDDLD